MSIPTGGNRKGAVVITGASSGLGAEMGRQFAAMVQAIEKRRARACVPTWQWVHLGMLTRILPLSVVRRMT